MLERTSLVGNDVPAGSSIPFAIDPAVHRDKNTMLRAFLMD